MSEAAAGAPPSRPLARRLIKFGARIPTLLLAAALSTLFLFNSDRERYYAPIRHVGARRAGGVH